MDELAKSHFSVLLIHIEYNSTSRHTINKLTCKQVRNYSMQFWSSASLTVAVNSSVRIVMFPNLSLAANGISKLTSFTNDSPLKINSGSHFIWHKITMRKKHLQINIRANIGDQTSGLV